MSFEDVSKLTFEEKKEIVVRELEEAGLYCETGYYDKDTLFEGEGYVLGVLRKENGEEVKDWNDFGKNIFSRKKDYYAVYIKVHLDLAEKIFEDETCKKSVIITPWYGNAVLFEPKDQAVIDFDNLDSLLKNKYPVLFKLFRKADRKACEIIMDLHNIGEIIGDRFVYGYTVNDQEGLNRFVKILKEHLKNDKFA